MSELFFRVFEDELHELSRIYAIYCFNSRTKTRWKVTLKGLGDSRNFFINKIHFVKDHILRGYQRSPLFLHCNKQQVEKRFGGVVEDLSEGFW